MSDKRLSAGRYPPGQAPRVSVEQIRQEIVGSEFIVRGKYTLCLLTLKNGTIVSGESSCVYPENYDQAKGEEISYKNAEEKIWMLEGYALAERRFQEEKRLEDET